MYYFDSWVEGARSDEQTSFLLQRYSYRPPAELYHLASDPEELNNLAGDPRFSAQRQQLSALLEKELTRQGETTERSEEHTSELQSLMRISYAVFCLKTNT